MAFGIDRKELQAWKENAKKEEIAFLTHYWIDDRFPDCDTVTKVACCNVEKLIAWGRRYGLQPEWIDHRADFPHYDLFGDRQLRILKAENQLDQIKRFKLWDHN
ncbi:hypothetical protein [Bacillus sp. Marseille-Q3570]|uniref:hypothetical protein n=1 Tax=Bacillus sp. Marseille-Q3570 TaxID=2963522 RepID=UPI0021B76A2F|nr:hypothetical protein [Bacillus sp. Marseille-Q3570]